MRAFKIAILVGLAFITLIGLFFFGPLGPASPYRRFHRRERDYYLQLAGACDGILRQHPTFTRHTDASKEFRYTWIDGNDVIWDQIRVTPDDPSLPNTVRALRPDEVLVAPKRVFIGFGVGRLAWAIIWEQDDTQTNRWTLYSNAEGLVRTVYEERR